MEFKLKKRFNGFGILHTDCPDEQFGRYCSERNFFHCGFCFAPLPPNLILQRDLLNDNRG